MSGGMIFVIVMIAIITVGRIVRMGMELEARKRGFTLSGKRGSHDEGRALTSELEQDNAMLRSKVARLEERMAVMERIATDAPNRLSAEIEKLRD
jgi:uncharacterized sporulation protein YeaH/YhbH (DUF444 family)